MTLYLGDIQIDRIIEMETPFMTPEDAFPDAPHALINEHRHWLEPTALCPVTHKLIISIQTYIIRTAQLTILVDTCIGCDKTNHFFPEWHQRKDQLWLQKLMNIGIHPEQVDFVFCTHLHGDHCGWNTRLIDGRWVPTFPNAKYIISKQEIDHAAAAGAPAYYESVLPIIETGQVVAVETDYALNDWLWLEPTPGHTPGHVALHLQSGNEHAILCGDLIHSPLQCRYPNWRYWIDSDPQQAIITRNAFLEDQCEHNRLVLTAHFPSPAMGYVVAYGDAFRFKFSQKP